VPRWGSYLDAEALDTVTAGGRSQSAAGEVSRVRTSPVGRGLHRGPHPLQIYAFDWLGDSAPRNALWWRLVDALVAVRDSEC
jgi:hypothetical protein